MLARTTQHLHLKHLLRLAALLALGLATVAQARTPEQTRWAEQAQAVTITRDDWGIAHVHGKTDADAVFGSREIGRASCRERV